jgi:hypothetical protein
MGAPLLVPGTTIEAETRPKDDKNKTRTLHLIVKVLRLWSILVHAAVHSFFSFFFLFSFFGDLVTGRTVLSFLFFLEYSV